MQKIILVNTKKGFAFTITLHSFLGLFLLVLYLFCCVIISAINTELNKLINKTNKEGGLLHISILCSCCYNYLGKILLYDEL